VTILDEGDGGRRFTSVSRSRWAGSARWCCSARTANLAIGRGQDATQRTQAALHGGKAKNVILFIGDGMGDSEVTAARCYQYGAAGRMNLDRFPFTGFQTTWPVKPAASPPCGRITERPRRAA
jgi:alkaline phosphatase